MVVFIQSCTSIVCPRLGRSSYGLGCQRSFLCFPNVTHCTDRSQHILWPRLVSCRRRSKLCLTRRFGSSIKRLRTENVCGGSSSGDGKLAHGTSSLPLFSQTVALECWKKKYRTDLRRTTLTATGEMDFRRHEHICQDKRVGGRQL